jgi:choline transporter-like protein 2/4/5
MSEKKYEADNIDPALENGPIEKRGCTDPLCCLIFVAFVVAAFILAFYGFGKGTPKLLAVPYDPDGLKIFNEIFFFFLFHKQ